MFKIICVTNSGLCANFPEQLEKVAAAKPGAVVLREKAADDYESLAVNALKICEKQGVECILHNFPETAVKLGVRKIHLPLGKLRGMPESERSFFEVIGASCHSLKDALEAEKLGCTYIFAGHIFDTDCKKGLPGRGTEFLSEVCKAVKIPVYAIGGINSGNIGEIRNAGAAGACIMSGFMTCENPAVLMERLKGGLQ